MGTSASGTGSSSGTSGTFSGSARVVAAQAAATLDDSHVQ